MRTPRYPSHLKSVLASIQDLFAAAGASVQVKDFGTILQLFRGDEDQAVVQFLSDMRAASKKRVALRSARSRAPGAEDIASLAQQLLDLKHDREKFDALLAKCEKVTVPNLKMIAAKFLGREIKGKRRRPISSRRSDSGNVKKNSTPIAAKHNPSLFLKRECALDRSNVGSRRGES